MGKQKYAILRDKPKPSAVSYLFSKDLIVKEDYSVMVICNGNIDTIKRKSDGQEFAIGDEVFCKFTNKSFGNITKLWQLGNQLRCDIGNLSLAVTGKNESGIVTTPY